MSYLRVCVLPHVATTVLAAHDIAAGQRVTSYPSVKDQLSSKYNYDDASRVVVDGTLITSRGPGTSLEFGLAILKV